jgi:hypothetical protein
MKLTSSQRWAIGAVGLAVLIACSPQSPEEPPVPAPNAPTLSLEMADGDIAPTLQPVSGGEAPAPGFAGRWAAAEAECGEPVKAFDLSAHSFAVPGGNTCAVTKVAEEHPTGRSAIYTVAADCTADNPAANDRFTLNFGAADTIMQLQQNDQAPVRLVRCP